MTIPTARADYSSTVSSFNPAAYWRLNETTPAPLGDAATNRGTLGIAATGLYLGGATHPVTGIPGAGSDTAANIPNTDHSYGPMRVRVPFLPALNQAAPFTAEFWARPDQQGATACPFASADFLQATRYGWLFYQDNPAGQWFFRLYNAAGNTAVQGGTVTAGVWHHVVGVYDGTNLLLYVNGVKVGGPTAMSGAFTPVTNPNIPLTIGGRADGFAGSFGFGGDMDEVAFYTNVLAEAEIQAHYQAGINSATTDYSALVLAHQPPGYWRLGEPTYVAPDPSTYPVAANTGTLGAAADGTDYPGITTGVAGPPYAGLGAGNHAYLFNGASGYIDCGFPVDLDAYSGPISIMTWINVNHWSRGWQAMVTKGDSAWRLHRNSSGGDTRFVGFGTTGLSNVDQAGTRAVDDGFWHHVVAVYDGSAKYIYVDGTLDVSTPVTGTLATDTYPIFIGENAQGTGRFFSGMMDEVAIFTNGLSAAQVLQVYNAAQVPPIVTQVQRTPADPLYEGYNITMTAATIGSLPMTNKWYKNTTLLTNKTSLTFSITNAAVGDSGSYALVVANAYGSTTSAVQVITVSSGPPLFLSQNVFDATRAIGGRVTYSVVAGGSAPVTYQWKHGSSPIPGATNSVLKLTNLQFADQGSYTVTLTNPYGTNNSSATGVVSVVTVTNFPFAGMYGNPLAYYRLNETSGTTAFDIASGLNGTLNGPIVTGVPGPQPPTWEGFESTNTAFQFDGAAARVQLPPFNLQTNRLTIVAWINPAGPQGDQTGILVSRNGNDLGGLFLNHPPNNTDALGFVWQGNGSWNDFPSGLVPVVGQWNFVALVIDPQKGTIYLDSGSGLQSSSFLATNQTVAWSNPNIGVDPGYTRFFNGSIDEVIVYDRSLSPAELANLDFLGSAGPTAPRIVQQPSPQTAYAGQPTAFSVEAVGALPLAYQWFHAGTNLPGATSATLPIPSVHATDAGSYYVAITNSLGSSNSVTVALSLVPLTHYPFAAMYGHPLAYYRLNETSGTSAADIAGGLNGTILGSMVLGVDGPRPPIWAGLESTNTAFQFDGSTTRVQLPSFNLQTNQLTIVAWINPNGSQSDQTGILVSRSDNNLGGFFLNHPPYNTDALSYVWEDTGSYDQFRSGLVPVVGQWNFSALVIDPQKGTVYLDKGDGTGLQSASFYPPKGNKTVIWDSPIIGQDSYGNRYFNGAIDEVVVYDRALSPAEIANLDSLGTSSQGTAPQIIAQPSSATVYAGAPASFTVGALGALPLAYQWRHAGTNLPGATSATLTVPSAYFITDEGNYAVVVTNSIGSSNSVAATLTVLAPPTFANLTNGLVLHLTFDTSSSGVLLDSSGRGNNATLVGSPALVPGKLGQAMHYNTDNSDPNNVIYNYATLGNPPDLQFGTSQNFSVAYWIRFTGGSVDLPVLCNDECGEGCAGFFFGPAYYTSGAWAWSFENSAYSAGMDADGAANSINDGQWHNVVSTFDRTGLGSTYLDGVLVDARPISTFTDTLDTVHPANVGQVGTADYKVAFGADVDDLAVWRRVLSSAEAESVYMVGQQGRSFDTYGPVFLALRKAGNDLELVWQTGTLLSSTTGVLGIYNPVAGASAPYYRVTPGPTPTFYRVKF